MKSRFPTNSGVAGRALRRAFPPVPLLAGLLVVMTGSASVVSAAPDAGTGAGTKTWQVAPAGPCARVDTSHPCSGGQCANGETSARSRFDATDVASGGLEGGGVFAPPEAIAFRGPGPCADPSTPCGDAQTFRIPSSEPPGGPGVIEQPVTPGTLPGSLPGLP